MIKMQRLNVVKYACSEKQAGELEARGFVRCEQKQLPEGSPGQGNAEKGKRKPAAGKDRKNEDS